MVTGMSLDENQLVDRLQEIARGRWPGASEVQCQLAKRLLSTQRMAGWMEDGQALIDRIVSQPRKG